LLKLCSEGDRGLGLDVDEGAVACAVDTGRDPEPELVGVEGVFGAADGSCTTPVFGGAGAMASGLVLSMLPVGEALDR
jgi:hypothetical protein